MSEARELALENKVFRLEIRIEKLEAKLTQIQAVVNEQAEDEGLWFNHKYATEDYLQQALRRLHGVIEENTDGI